MEKYELTNNSKIFGWVTVYQIRALKDFSNVKKGDLGGWIESEENLSHQDNAWIYDNARVYGNAEVYGDAKVYDNAKVCGRAEVI
jgi:hypothetical protein